MHCDQFEELLSEYMDGSLAQALKLNMDSHRGGCSACSRLVSEMQLIYTAMDTMPALDTPPWMHERIMARVEAEGTNNRKRSWLSNPWQWVGAVAAITAVVTMAVIIPSADKSHVQMSLLSKPTDAVTNQQADLSISVEQATSSGNPLGWVVRLTPKSDMQAEVRIVTFDHNLPIESSYWKGLANGQPISLPAQASSSAQALYAEVIWSDETRTSLWLPQQLLPDGHLARIQNADIGVGQALSTISAAWGVKILLKGHMQSDVRLNLNARAASVDQVMTSMAAMLGLKLSRPNTDTFVLSQE
ncbi:MAG: zf-HC2 domain-containing protein [Armatimonadota bacterium]